MEPTTPRRPGRPTKGTRPQTPAERSRESRRRRREASMTCTDDLQAATDRSLLDGLALRLKAAKGEGEPGEVARWVAARIVGELCRRHGIVPDGFVTSRNRTKGFVGSASDHHLGEPADLNLQAEAGVDAR